MTKMDVRKFSEVTQLLTQVKLDDKASKDRIYNRLTYKMEQGIIKSNYTTKDGIYMKKVNWKSIAVTTGALICLGGAFSTTTFAQDMIQTIMARFQVGNMTITQYDHEEPVVKMKGIDINSDSNTTGAQAALSPVDSTSSREESKPATQTLDQARIAMGVNFPAPTWLSEHFTLMNVVSHGQKMAELVYDAKDGKVISLLISSGGQNGIGTTEQVKTETISGTKFYFANGIVIWENAGFTYELYAEQDFDNASLMQIVASMSTGKK
jgi:hypothetical protein